MRRVNCPTRMYMHMYASTCKVGHAPSQLPNEGCGVKGEGREVKGVGREVRGEGKGRGARARGEGEGKGRGRGRGRGAWAKGPARVMALGGGRLVGWVSRHQVHEGRREESDAHGLAVTRPAHTGVISSHDVTSQLSRKGLGGGNTTTG